MKTKIFLFPIIVMLLISSSCDKSEINIDDEKTAGYFILSELRNNENTSLKSSEYSITSSFDFGDLKASKEFFFLLVNGGDESIFDITLSTDKNNFRINPSNINQLSGGTLINTAENTGIIPILTLGITHGINLNGVGYAELLPMGINLTVLTINGKTIDNGDTIDISNSFDISVNSKIMDIELYENSSKIDILKPRGSVSSNLGGLGFIRYYSVYESSTISIKNIGNVSIDLYYGDTDIQNNLITLSEMDSTSVNLVDFINILVLDSKGTITKNERIQLGNDGKGYLVIVKDNHQ